MDNYFLHKHFQLVLDPFKDIKKAVVLAGRQTDEQSDRQVMISKISIPDRLCVYASFHNKSMVLYLSFLDIFPLGKSKFM